MAEENVSLSEDSSAPEGAEDAPVSNSNNSAASNGTTVSGTGVSGTGVSGAGAPDLNWVWREVRKRVFLKISFSLGVADALAAAIPITLDGDSFVVGFAPKDYALAPALNGGAVRNTIEKILESAAKRRIHFEVIEGTTLAEWEIIKMRREKAQSAMIAMANSEAQAHHFEDVMSQIVGEIRHRVSQVHDRAQPVVRASLILDVAASLADAEDMLFDEAETREGKRAMSRIVDRIATFLDVQPIILAIEIERHRRQSKKT